MSPLSSAQQAVLRSGAWFASLPPALQAELFELANRVPVAQGLRLFARGDAPDGLYGVLSGAMRITAVSAQGKEAILALVEPPQWFGEIALFDGQARTHDAWAEADTELVHLSQDALHALLARQPTLWPHFGRLLTHKMRLLMGIVEDTALQPPATRLARRLLAMLDSHGELNAPSGGTLLRLPQEQLGMMLSLSRQTVNQILRQFEREGALRLHRGGIEVADLAVLRRLAD